MLVSSFNEDYFPQVEQGDVDWFVLSLSREAWEEEVMGMLKAKGNRRIYIS